MVLGLSDATMASVNISVSSSARVGFQYATCRYPGPRQGKNMRLCVVKRELLPRGLLWRVVKVRNPDGTKTIRFGAGQGRSAYVSKDLKSVNEALRRKKLTKALSHGVPPEVRGELQERATAWDRVPASEKGFLFCDVYGEEGVSSAVEEIQSIPSTLGDEELFSDA